jgi:REP element-mobilizing transposase RayT
MARPLRIEFAGALYHVTARGNAQGAMYLGAADRHDFLGTLGRVVESHRWLCHAYCLMTNHYHLLVETPEANLSHGMRQLNGLYTQHFNRRHERVGHVLQGRFKAILVEREAHLLELARYVVLNPVRAGMVTVVEDYAWSSLRATLGLAAAPSWLTIDLLLASFGSRTRFRDFVREGVGAISPWAALRGVMLGSDGFIERMGSRLGDKATQGEFPRRERLVCRESLEAIFPPRIVADRSLRNDRIRGVAQSLAYTVAEVSRHLGLHYSTVSRIAAGSDDRPTHLDPAAASPDEQIQDLTPRTP